MQLVYSISGQLIAEKTVNVPYDCIDTSALEKGLYFLKLEGKRFQTSYKIIKLYWGDVQEKGLRY